MLTMCVVGNERSLAMLMSASVDTLSCAFWWLMKRMADLELLWLMMKSIACVLLLLLLLLLMFFHSCNLVVDWD